MHLEGIYAALILSNLTESLPESLSMFEHARHFLKPDVLGMNHEIYAWLLASEGNRWILTDFSEPGLPLFEDAVKIFETVNEQNSVFHPGFVKDQLCDSLWGISELLRRLTFNKPPTDPHLIKALQYIDKLIILTTDDPDRNILYHQSIFLRGVILRQMEKLSEAVINLRKSLQFFVQIENLFWRLQATLELFIAISVQDSDNLTELTRLFKDMHEMAETFLENYQANSLVLSEQVLLSHAALQLARIFHINSYDGPAIEWYLLTFEIRLKHGLFAGAISLDDHISEVLPNGHKRKKRYVEDLCRASLNIDPKLEPVDYTSIGRILRRYFSEQEPISVFTQKKQEALKQVNSLKALGRTQEAIALMENSVDLIDWENPEDIDLDLIKTLQDHLPATDHNRLEGLQKRLVQVRDTIQSRDFLKLADAYFEKGWDGLWALNVATAVDFRSRYFYDALNLKLQKGSIQTNLDEEISAVAKV